MGKPRLYVWSSEKPERVEEVLIRIRVDKSEIDRHRTAVNLIVGKKSPEMDAGDVLNVDLRFEVAYFGDIAAKLEAVHEIASDPLGGIVSVDIKELLQGRFLIHEVLSKLDRLIREKGQAGA